jgi:hypothetical protein
VDIPDEFNRCLGTRKGIAKLYAQATPNIFGILKNGHSPCKLKCPARVNVQGYVQLIKKKGISQGGRTHPPAQPAFGHLRPHLHASLRIRMLARQGRRCHRHPAPENASPPTWEMEMLAAGKLTLPEEKTPAPDAKKVAIIGGGPAGLTAANDLADAGCAGHDLRSHGRGRRHVALRHSRISPAQEGARSRNRNHPPQGRQICL